MAQAMRASLLANAMAATFVSRLAKDLGLQHSQLGTESRNACARNLGQPLVSQVRDDTEQVVYAITSDRRDDAKLRKMRADRIDHRGLLTNE